MQEFYQYQGNTIKAKKSLNWAKQLASRFQISFIITANLNQDIVVREDHRPHISDLTFANRLPSQIDSAILLYRDELYRDSFVVDSKNYGLKGMTEIIVINSNNYQYGPILIPMDPFI